MKKHKFKIVLFIVIAVLVYVFYYNFYRYSGTTVNINGYVFKTDVVTSIVDMQKGLSGRETITDNQAMLFVYEDKNKRVFWMKDMNFNIDLLWIDDDQIVGYEKDMLAPAKDTPLDNLKRYSSNAKVNKVLEIKAGLIDKLNIKIGDKVNINI